MAKSQKLQGSNLVAYPPKVEKSCCSKSTIVLTSGLVASAVLAAFGALVLVGPYLPASNPVGVITGVFTPLHAYIFIGVGAGLALFILGVLVGRRCAPNPPEPQSA